MQEKPQPSPTTRQQDVLTPSSVAVLQRTAGNAQVARLIAEAGVSAGGLQPRLVTVQRKAGYTAEERATAASGVLVKRISPNRFGVLGEAFLFYNFPIGRADADVRDTRAVRLVLEELRKSIYATRQPTTVDPSRKNKWSHGKPNPDETPVVGQIKVVGYTDPVDFGSGARERGRSNYRLRVERAGNIKAYLEAGFQRAAEKMGRVSVTAEMPDKNFLFGGDSATDRALNRSVLVWILPQAKPQKPVSRQECKSIAAEIEKRALRDNDRTGVFTANIMKMACYGGYDGGFLSQDSVAVYVQSQAGKKKPEPVEPTRDAFREINEAILAHRGDKEAAYKKIRTVTEHIMLGYQEVGRYKSIYTGHDYRGGWLERIITGERTHALPPHVESLVLWLDARIKGNSVYHAFSKDR